MGLCIQSMPFLEPEMDPRRILFADFLWKEVQSLIRLSESQKWLLGAFYSHTPRFRTP